MKCSCYVIVRTENKKCESGQSNPISKQKPTLAEKPKNPDKQFLRGKSQSNLMNKSKNTRIFGRTNTNILDLMDG